MIAVGGGGNGDVKCEQISFVASLNTKPFEFVNRAKCLKIHIGDSVKSVHTLDSISPIVKINLALEASKFDRFRACRFIVLPTPFVFLPAPFVLLNGFSVRTVLLRRVQKRFISNTFSAENIDKLSVFQCLQCHVELKGPKKRLTREHWTPKG